MPARLPAPARREQILDVALTVFATTGYHGASMNDVAEAAGVTKPVLYQHVESKRDLYQALLRESGTRMINSIIKGTSEATDGKSLTELGYRSYFRWVATDTNAFQLLFASGARREREFSDVVRSITAEAAQTIAPLIDVDIDDVRRQTLAHALVGLAEGASRMLVELGGDFDPDAIAHDVSSLAWAGLRSLPKS